MKGAGYQLTEARLRKIINHIRVNGLLHWLIATSKGYYIEILYSKRLHPSSCLQEGDRYRKSGYLWCQRDTKNSEGVQ
jgi:hypothetical protein